jgi:hypothetical protein
MISGDSSSTSRLFLSCSFPLLLGFDSRWNHKKSDTAQEKLPVLFGKCALSIKNSININLVAMWIGILSFCGRRFGNLLPLLGV